MNAQKPARYILIAMAVCISIFLPEISAADPLDNWHPRNVLTDGYLSDVTYGNNTFVIAGGDVILTSEDGVAWNDAVVESGWRVNAVTWGEDLFVGVGSGGIVVTSVDGKTWKRQTAGIEYSLTDVVYGNGLFVAAGYDTQTKTGITLTSADGSVWKLGSSSISLAAITFGNGLFVGVESSSKGKIHTSPDGVNWTKSQFSRNLWGVSYSNGMFHAFGRQGMVISRDGVHWTVGNSIAPVLLNDVYFGNDRFIAVGDYNDYESRILSSQDGINWKYVDLPMPRGHLLSVIYGNGTFIAVGQYGTILSSKDGVNWFDRSRRLNLCNAAYGNGTFIGVNCSDRAIISSPDGISWTSRNELVSNGYLGNVIFGEGKFVAVGGNNNLNAGLILTSSDGIVWEETLRGAVSQLSAVVYGKGIFVAAGAKGLILTSRDGVRWTKRESNTTSSLSGLAYGNDIFVAAGEGGAITTSADGVEWRSVSSGTVSPLEDVAFGNGIFVAVSASFLSNEHVDPEGIILSSSDGVHWKSAAVPTTYYITGIAFGGGFFTAVGLNYEGCYGFTGYRFIYGPAILLTSTDGMNWEERYRRDNAPHSGVAFGNNTFIVLGCNLILQSDPLSGKCTAIVSADLSLSVPIINFAGAYIWCDAQCEINAGDSIMCRVTGYGTANSADFKNCQSSVLTADMNLHIPFLTFMNFSYQTDFEYVPTADGQVWFSLTGADRN